ncbi:MAG TPA: GreA/GreB family elongation factor [Candidatus Sulfotelmatobacter sp.]|nr:GreA/GreB family elongation factor [Candidatus Sulfotelmatobacter sp.]
MSRAFTKERDDVPEPEVVPPTRQPISHAPPEDRSRVGYGATVTLDGAAEGSQSTFTIVAEDASDVRAGKIAFDSPLAVAIVGKKVGQRGVWHRPAGDRTVVVRSIRYD